MTRKEVIEGNKLIAEFIGYSVGFPHKTDKYGYIQTVEGYIIPSIVNPSPHPSDIDTHQFSLTDLRFHSSWDWLMPCIGKISNQCEEPDELDNLKYCLLTNNIEEAWKFVVNYLTYYYEYNSTRKNSLLSNS